MESILTNIEDIYEQTLQEFKEYETPLDYFLDEKSFLKCIEKQKQLLESYLKYNNSSTVHTQKMLQEHENFYLKLDFPYVLLIKYLNIFKNNALKFILKDIDNYEQKLMIEREINDTINSLTDIISQAYIKKDALIFEQKTTSKFKDFQLFQHHLTWVDNIISSILKSDIKSFPLVNAQNCSYAKVMQYPESLMICIDASLCKQLEILHNLIHTQSAIFYRFYVRKEFVQAYFTFKEFLDSVEKFLSLLKDLYYLSHSDLENSFFKLIELLGFTDTTQTLTLFDIQGLKQLNNLHGEKKIDMILKDIELSLRTLVDCHPENSLLIKAISANFYILHVNLNSQQVKEKIQLLCTEVNKELKTKYPEISIQFKVASFELDKEVKYHKDELIRIILELKNRALKENKKIFVCTQEEKESIRKWLNERYFTIGFLQEKIKEKAIDVMLQPIYNTTDKTIYAVEALARIKDKQKFLPAGLFIDTLYEINLVTELDILILDAILKKKEYILEKDIKVFINSAAESLSNKKYIEKLYLFLQDFPSQYVVLEITEQQALQNLDILKDFHKKTGVTFAIDDFGTGYSALKTVSDMVEEGLVQVLKMDGSLIANLDKEQQTQKIVQTIAQMCQTFEILSLAEFIENNETLTILQDYQVDLAQGYFLAKPMVVEELRALQL